MTIQELYEKIRGLFEPLIERKVQETDSWDGSESRWNGDAAAYCDDCLISVWKEAGKDEPVFSHCMLPIRGPEASQSTMESAAIQAAAGGRGLSAVKKPDDVPQDAWDSAIKKAAKTIASAYEEMNKEAPESVMEKARALSMDDIYGKVWEASQRKYPAAYMHNVYAESDGSLFALLTQNDRLYRSPLTITDNEIVLEDWVEVVQEFVEVRRTKTQIIRQANGQARWFSISATSVLNRVGEIDSQALFDSFVAYATSTGNYPYRTFYHKGEQFKTGQADFLARDGNCYITSGLYDNSEIARMEQQAIERDPAYWGESIGYIPTSSPQLIEVGGIKIPVYRSGINVEISTLPEKEAANLFTVIRQEVNRMMTANERQVFLKLFNGNEDEMNKWLSENVDATNRAIQEGGLITRSQQGEVAQEGERQIEIGEEVVSEVVRQVTESESFTGFGTQLNDIAEAIEVLNGATDKLRTRLEGLQQDVTQRLTVLERSKTVERQEWANDLPAKNIVRVGLKQPRFAPDDPTLALTSTDKANSTLSKLPKI